LTVRTVQFVLLGGVQAVATWRGNLVELRRRRRLFLFAATAIYIAVTAGTGFLRTGPGSEPGSLVQIAVVTLILPAVAAPANPALVAPLERAMTHDRAYLRRGSRSLSSPCGSACRNTGCAS